MNEIMKEEVASMRFFLWMYCRTFQIVLRIALPFLPYRVSRIVDSCQDLDNVLLSEKIGSVLIVTDEGGAPERSDLASGNGASKMPYCLRGV